MATREKTIALSLIHGNETQVSNKGFQEQRFTNEAKQMNISDLQYIESVDASEVQGAGKYKKYYKKYYGKYYSKKAGAVADGDAQAYGDKTFAATDTFALADADAGFSVATSKSVAFAKSY